jgi:hypothetical protein
LGSFYDPEFVDPDCLEPGTLPWLLARHRSIWFPVWLFTHWRGNGSLGRDAWPAVVLTTLTLLRWTEEGMSRRGAIRRAERDLTWRAAMGLSIGSATPSEKTLRDFERFLRERHADTQTPRYLLLHEHIVRQCLNAGVADARRMIASIDSTPMWCYGAVRDTVRLLGDGLRMLANDWAFATKRTLAEIAEAWRAPFLLEKSTKGAFRIDWHNPKARAEVVTKLAKHVVDSVAKARDEIESDVVHPSRRKELLRSCRNLMRVIKNDLESDANGNLIIARRVAADRLISVTDPEARHGRKSKSQTFEGFKIHLLGDVVSGLILSAAVTRGNEHDGAPAHRLIRRAKALYGQLDRVLGDTAYGGAKLRHVVERVSRVKLLSPPPPVAAKEGRLGKMNIIIDFEERTATCANGVTTDNLGFFWSSEHGTHAPVFAWPRESCDSCPLRDACLGKGQRTRRVIIHPYERELRAARDEWNDPKVREAYRVRSQCERLINQVTRHGGRKARAFGLGSAQLQAHAIAMACNLRLLARAVASASGGAAVEKAA